MAYRGALSDTVIKLKEEIVVLQQTISPPAAVPAPRAPRPSPPTPAAEEQLCKVSGGWRTFGGTFTFTTKRILFNAQPRGVGTFGGHPAGIAASLAIGLVRGAIAQGADIPLSDITYYGAEKSTFGRNNILLIKTKEGEEYKFSIDGNRDAIVDLLRKLLSSR